MAANWIEDTNRFGLEKPPDAVLSALWTFDPQLVLIPSRQDRTYLLARRRQYSAGMSDTVLLENKHPDTNMLFVHQLLPVAPLVFKGGVIKWEQQAVNGLLDQLRARDTWALTGGPDGDPDRAWQAVEEAERDAEKRARRTMWQDFHHRGRDAYRSILARVGSRNKRASDYHGVARTPRVAGSTQQ